MKFLGITRYIDSLGRLVIPKEIRELYGLSDIVEILPTDEGVLIRNPRYIIEIKENEEKNSKCRSN